MEIRPEVSLIIPTCKQARFIRREIASHTPVCLTITMQQGIEG